MDPFTLPRSLDTDRFGLAALSDFYRWNAPIYDWTRPFILWGRRALLLELELRPGIHVLDVGCGTGWSFPHLIRAGASVTGIEPSPSMRQRALLRAHRMGETDRVRLCEAPFGEDDRHRETADRLLFSYSLSMIPPFADVVLEARRSLRPAGKIGVVDFMDAVAPMRRWLSGCHVAMSRERLAVLRDVFPRHRLAIRTAGPWSYYLFWGER